MYRQETHREKEAREAIGDFAARQEKLERYIGTSQFNAVNISAMIGGAGKNIGIAIDSFLKRGRVLHEFMISCGFEAENISSMLAGSGNNIGVAIDELIANKSKLEELITSSKTPRSVSYKLSKSSSQLTKNIAKMLVSRQAKAS
ncbi:MAG: hypothetical protein LCH20_00240 [Proteobacteria bacterium]|nr:hypothetical protein [Pseudomonadota bacterium]